jgi:hypothetical protein
MNQIIVKSMRPTFRRAGIEFTPQGVVLDRDSITEEQAIAIANEPMLVAAPYAPPEVVAEALAGKKDTSADAKKGAK